MAIAGFVADVLICFGIPLAGIWFCCKKKRSCLRAAVIGVLCFVISQVVIRIPLLTMVLPQFAWFQIMQMNPWIYGLFLGFTAGLAEEGARWIFMKYFLLGKRKRSIVEAPCGSAWEFSDGLAFGLGHGGIEAILFVGINAVVTIVMAIAGAYPMGMVNASDVWIGGIERIFAMSFHIGASLLIMYGLRVKKSLVYFLLALLLHTVMDAAIVILPAIFSIGMIGIEAWCGVFGIATLLAGIFVYARKKRISSQANLYS